MQGKGWGQSREDMEVILCMLSWAWAWLALETSVLLLLSISVVCWIIETRFTNWGKKSYQQLSFDLGKHFFVKVSFPVRPDGFPARSLSIWSKAFFVNYSRKLISLQFLWRIALKLVVEVIWFLLDFSWLLWFFFSPKSVCHFYSITSKWNLILCMK